MRKQVGCEHIVDMAYGNEYNKLAIALIKNKLICRGSASTHAHFHSIKQLRELYNYLTGEKAEFANISEIKSAFMNIKV